ncbi:hypothetical protein BH18ACI2_BH18ACI2_17240 [soil metagenome]
MIDGKKHSMVFHSSFITHHSSFRFFVCFVCFVCFMISLSPSTRAHKFHASFTDIAYNPAERSAEIIIRTFPDDLENILTKRAGRAVRLDGSKETESLVFAYLQDTFQLKRNNGTPVKLAWVGMEAQVDLVRIYVEAKQLPTGLNGAQVRQQFLCELFEDQINAVNLRDNGKQAALIFKPGDKFQSVEVK